MKKFLNDTFSIIIDAVFIELNMCTCPGPKKRRLNTNQYPPASVLLLNNKRISTESNNKNLICSKK